MVFAIRGKTETFDAAVEPLTSRYDPLKIFHLQEFLEKSEANKYRSTYEEQVKDVITFYQSLEPSRGINFDASLFAGRIDRQLVDVETTNKHRTDEVEIPKSVTKTRDVLKKENVPQLVCQKSGNVAAAAAAFCGTLGFLFGGPGAAAAAAVTCAQAGDSAEDESCNYVDNYVMVTVPEEYSVQVPYRQVLHYRDTYERKTHEEYKVLAGGIKIFMKKVVGEWELAYTEKIGDYDYGEIDY